MNFENCWKTMKSNSNSYLKFTDDIIIFFVIFFTTFKSIWFDEVTKSSVLFHFFKLFTENLKINI